MAQSIVMLLLTGCWSAQGAERTSPPPRELAEFAMRNEGDAGRGQILFTNSAAGCARCHSTDGSRVGAGPALSTVGDKFSRRELIRAILEPSAFIAVGYGTTIVETKAGEEFQGIIQQATPDALELRLADGRALRVAASEIQQQRASSVSLMPEGLERAFSLQEFTDLVAYLETLRQGDDGLAFARGMPARIPVASRPVVFDPLFGTNVQVRHPSWFGLVPGFTNRWVILEHEGRSWFVRQDRRVEHQSPFLDLSGTVRVGGGSGLLSIVFHPKFAGNHRYFIKYQRMDNGRPFTIIDERQFAADFGGDSGATAKELTRIECTTTDHTGGAMEFGRDGYLYIGMGDSGPQRDPQGHGQDMQLLLGKLLRIDVDRAEAGRAYSVPKDNPFVGRPDVRPEIWASGFREPWRICFDPATDELWVGDVGQDAIEELTIARAGENHGWNVFEGFTPYSAGYRRDGARYTPPVFAYPRRYGASITAGFVYRGRRAPALVGRHICGDFNSRRIWAVAQTNRVLASVIEIGRAPGQLVSFAQDPEGELYVAGYDNGSFHRLNLSAVNLKPRETRPLLATSERDPVRWRHTLSEPSADWTEADFADAGWVEAPGGFGTRATPGAVARTEWRGRDIWLRREFTLSTPPPNTSTLALRIHHDEDAEVYLNGIEIARLQRWTTEYVEIPVRATAAALRSGRNVLAIHCRQNSGAQYIDAGLVEILDGRQAE